jgi:hypothetical protein
VGDGLLLWESTPVGDGFQGELDGDVRYPQNASQQMMLR